MGDLVVWSKPAGALLFRFTGEADSAARLALQLERVAVSGHGAEWTVEGAPNLREVPDGGELSLDDVSEHPGTAKLAAVLQSLQPTAAWVLVELDYFDMDYRSEFSVTHETAFGVRAPSCSRLHFFGPVEGVETAGSVRRAIIGLSDAYLGYMVVRPQFPGTVGRSMISSSANTVPPAVGAQPLLLGGMLSRRVRTAVREHVEVLGVPLSVMGVPFMEQDGHLLRCAHVSAWIAHYTAVLRGVVPRRATAAFHLAEDGTGAYGRRYPSMGLNTDVLSRVLRRLDLPPEVVDISTLVESRKLRWYDRAQLRRRVLELNPEQVSTPLRDDENDTDSLSAEAQEELAQIWTAENLTAHASRYLNSGIPVIVAEDVAEHTRVICGYLRSSDLTVETTDDVEETVAQTFAGESSPDGESARDEHDAAVSGRGDETDLVKSTVLGLSGIEAFLVQDDQDSPYLVKPVAELLAAAVADKGLSLVVPLPRGLWMSGDTAEQHGAALFEHMINDRRDKLDVWGEEQELADAEHEQYSKVYEHLHAGVLASSGTQAIRSYVAASSSFKIGFADRVGDDTAAETLGNTRLPKFVWAVELIERDARDKRDGSPFVNGTVLLDASIVEDAEKPELFASPLFIHLRGQVASLTRPLTQVQWRRTTLEPYRSGRWGAEDRDDEAAMLARSWKGATSST